MRGPYTGICGTVYGRISRSVNLIKCFGFWELNLASEWVYSQSKNLFKVRKITFEQSWLNDSCSNVILLTLKRLYPLGDNSAHKTRATWFLKQNYKHWTSSWGFFYPMGQNLFKISSITLEQRLFDLCSNVILLTLNRSQKSLPTCRRVLITDVGVGFDLVTFFFWLGYFLHAYKIILFVVTFLYLYYLLFSRGFYNCFPSWQKPVQNQ